MIDLINREDAIEVLDDFQASIENGANEYALFRGDMQGLESVNPYKIVYDHLMQCNMCKGIYDAKNGNEHFMYGISLVMELIANKIGDETCEEFSDMFFDNMEESRRKAGLIDD